MKKLFYGLVLLLVLFSIVVIPAKAGGNIPLIPCLKESENVICNDGNVYNGFFWYGSWVPGYPTFETQFLRMPDVSVGSAVIYPPGVMLANAQYRGLSITGFAGEIAVPFCSEIGHTVWLKRPGHDWEGPFLVADCTKRGDLYGVIEFRDQVVEIDFDTAVRWGMAKYISYKDSTWTMLGGRMDGVILSKIPPTEIKTQPIDLSVWFLQNVNYASQKENRNQVENYIAPNTNNVAIGVDNSNNPYPLWMINKKWVVFK